MSFGELFKAAAPFIPTLISAMGANRALKQTPAEQMQAELLRQQMDYQRQAADPNSPLMKSYAAANEDKLRRDFAQSVSGLVNAQRRQTRLGRTPLFNAENADQQISRAAQLGLVDAENAAVENARKSLTGLAQGTSNTAAGFGNMVAGQKARQQGRADFNTGLAQTGTDLLSKVLTQTQPKIATPQATTTLPSTQVKAVGGGGADDLIKMLFQRLKGPQAVET